MEEEQIHAIKFLLKPQLHLKNLRSWYFLEKRFLMSYYLNLFYNAIKKIHVNVPISLIDLSTI